MIVQPGFPKGVSPDRAPFEEIRGITAAVAQGETMTSEYHPLTFQGIARKHGCSCAERNHEIRKPRLNETPLGLLRTAAEVSASDLIMKCYYVFLGAPY